jgi:hypothetical protein
MNLIKTIDPIDLIDNGLRNRKRFIVERMMILFEREKGRDPWILSIAQAASE